VIQPGRSDRRGAGDHQAERQRGRPDRRRSSVETVSLSAVGQDGILSHTTDYLGL